METALSLRERLFAFAKDRYGTEPEYLWSRYPRYAVLRRPDTKKWYALFMDVPRDRLGLAGTDRADVLDVKIDDAFYRDDLFRRPGHLPGYHMGGAWVTALLDGTVPFEELCGLVDASWRAAAEKKKTARPRPPKEWLCPVNPSYFDLEAAFAASDTLLWKQTASIRPGDTVYLYVGAPVSAVRYACRVMETDIPYDYEDARLTIRRVMKLRLLRRYGPDRFPLSRLKDFGVFAVRGARTVPTRLAAALHQDEP